MEPVSAATGAMGSVLGKLGALFADGHEVSNGDVESLKAELQAVHAFLKATSQAEDPGERGRRWMKEARELSYDVEDALDKFMLHSRDGSGAADNDSDGFSEKMSAWLSEAAARRRTGQEISDAISRAGGAEAEDPRRDCSLYRETGEPVGVDGPAAQLIRMVDGGGKQLDLEVVSMVGCGGLGKTTLARRVYDTMGQQFECRAFVSVSRRPHVVAILSDIRSQLGYEYAQSLTEDAKSLLDSISNFLQDKRYFIIVDDVWDVQTWDILKGAFPKGNFGSRIITTTRIHEVAKSCCASCGGRVYTVSPLSAIDSERLFFKLVFNSGEQCPSHLKRVSDKILQKCGGLPLAIIAISGLLIANTHEDQWEQVYSSIRHGLGSNPAVERTMRILLLGYFDLTPCLKSCLLYLSVFPEGCAVKKERLVMRWIAEGFIPEEHGHTLYESGERCFNELIDRNLIQPGEINKFGEVESCRVHGIIFDFLVSMSNQDNFVTLLGVPGVNPEPGNKVRRLSLQGDSEIPADLILCKARSLSVFGHCVKMPARQPPAAPTHQAKKMPLGQRAGDKSDSRYCGVEVLDFPAGDGLPAVLTHSLSSAFDFLLAPLVDPDYRPTPGAVLPVAASDLVLSPSQWSSHIVGKVSEWIDLDSEDEQLRLNSELTLKQEIAWATHLSLQACVLPPPKRSTCANYARVVNNILQGLTNMQLWLRIPLEKSESMDEDHDKVNNNNPTSETVDSWESWNSFRLLCEHSSQLYVALDILSSLPSMNSLGRWFGEPVRAAIVQTDAYLTNARGYPCLPKRHQTLLTGFFNHSVQVIISGRSNHNLSQVSEGVLSGDENHTEDTPTRHALGPYLDYIAYLYQRMDPLPEQERFEINYRDFLQSPLQPLMDNLEAQTYETFEKDTVKYTQYQRAIAKALVDKVSDDEVSTARMVLMVVGAGRGPLVRASLQAAEETGRKLKVYAVEKNPNAVITLHSLIKLEGWESMVTIISSDMRCWDAPEKADILVSELLGSFGDNELSPECLDGAQRFLKPDGISIPSSYTSFIQPVTASKLHNDIKAHKDIAHFETAYVVKLHRVARLAPPQEVFSFTHPNFSPKATNQRYTKLQFELPQDTGSCLVHGFAGYFDAVLYKDVHLGIEPNTCTPNMFSWFPIFFPLRKPIYVPSESPIEVHFWRCCGSTKVWYEWALVAPSPSPIHNSNGRSYWVGL